jgi:hypothetical protein
MVFFDAYNKCNMDKQAEIYTLEFYHDKGGLMIRKVLEGTKKKYL